LLSLAGSVRRRGCSRAEILALLSEVNRRRCVPPLDDRELELIATSACRYVPRETIT
jgi:putative DNA primase/helicase